MPDDGITLKDKIVEYYEQVTDQYYVGGWDNDHIHFGLFTAEESRLSDRDLTRARSRPIVRAHETVLRPARIAREHIVVDAGCGVGGTAIDVARRFGCRVVGLNISKHQLEIARSRAAEAGLSDRVEFIWADCSEAFPLPAERYDVVFNIESSCHYSDRRNFLAECSRILKPGGLLTTLDWMAADGISRVDYERAIRPVCEAWFFKSLETRSSYTEKFHDAGLEIVDFVDWSEPAFPNVRIMGCFQRQLVLKSMFVRLPAIEEQWIQQCESLCSAWADGYFRLQHFLARKPCRGAAEANAHRAG